MLNRTFDDANLRKAANDGDIDYINAYIAQCNNDFGAFDRTNDAGETPLLIVAYRGRGQIFNLVLEHTTNLDQTDKKHGNTALIIEAELNRKDNVTRILAKGADINKARAKNDNKSPLSCLVALGNLAMVNTLVAHHADVNKTNKSGLSPLHDAAKLGHLEIVEALLNNGADLEIENLDGATPLMVAANADKLEVVRALLVKGAQVNKTTKSEGATALYTAVVRGNLDVVNELLAHNADVNVVKKDDLATPLDIAVHNNRLDLVKALLSKGAKVKTNLGALGLAASSKNPEIWQALLTSGADANEADIYGNTPLCSATASDNLDMVEALLDRHGADVNKPGTREGATALHIAVARGKFDVVNQLLAHNADVNVIKKDGLAPLDIAVANNRLDLVKALLANGAKVNTDLGALGVAASSKNPEIWQALLASGADANQADINGNTPLCSATACGDLGMVEALLDRHGAAINKAGTNDGKTPFWIALERGHVEVVEAFLQRGVDANQARTTDGATPLSFAIEKSNLELVTALLASGTQDDKDNLLFMAVKRDQIDIVEALIANGANPNSTRKDGTTVLWTAIKSPDMVNVLAANGARVNVTKIGGETPLTTYLKSKFPNTIRTLLLCLKPDDDLSDISKQDLFTAIKKLDKGAQASLCYHAINPKTGLGKRMWHPDGSHNCSLDKGILSEICTHLKTLDPKFEVPKAKSPFQFDYGNNNNRSANLDVGATNSDEQEKKQSKGL